MTNDKIVTMSRELAQKLDDLLYIMTGHDSHPKLIRKYGEEWWTPLDTMRAEICTLLAAPVVERQEPVAYLDENDKFVFIGYEKLRTACWVDGNDAIPDAWKPLYTSPTAPVSMVAMRAFANAMIDIALEGEDAYGSHIQELAVKHGLLKPEQRTERCGDVCSCAEYADFPVECFRKVKELNQ